MLLREAIGGTLRRARTLRRRTLREVSRRARVSLGYLSEVERGRKEPSSELLAAICDALDLTLPDLLADAARSMVTGTPGPVVLETRRPIGGRQTDLRLAREPDGPLPVGAVAVGSLDDPGRCEPVAVEPVPAVLPAAPVARAAA